MLEAQRAGYAEADPSADVDGFDARSKLAILAALAFGERIVPSDIFTEGIRRITPIDFEYAHQLHHTIRLICAARQTPSGVLLSVRPSLIPQSTILASVRGAYNAVWVRGKFGADTFYYGRGAGPHPTGVAVASDLMRVAREIRYGGPERVSPFAHARLGEYKPIPVTLHESAYFLRFRVEDRPGIIAQLAAALAAENVSIDAVLQLPHSNWRDLPFVITVQPTTEASIRAAVARMAELNFLVEPPLALPMEQALCSCYLLKKLHRLQRRDLPLLPLFLHLALHDLPPRLVIVDLQQPVELQRPLLIVAVVGDHVDGRPDLLRRAEQFLDLVAQLLVLRHLAVELIEKRIGILFASASDAARKTSICAGGRFCPASRQ